MITSNLVLTISFLVGISGQASESSSKETLVFGEQNGYNKTSSKGRNYAFDFQIQGFNGTKITSGPIILADKRTLFISDIQYQHFEDILVFCGGIGSPYGAQQQCFAEESFLGNHTNVYITLPANLTLDTIDFITVSVQDTLLDYVLFEKINRSVIKDYQEENMQNTIYRVPKCCKHDEYLTTTAKGCVEAEDEIILDFNVFESNETGLDPNISLSPAEYEIRPYVQGLKCKDNEYRVEVGDELHGLIYNSSLIIQGSGILAHGQFCVEMIKDNGNYTTNALYCYAILVETVDPNFYLPVLIISTICFAASAAAYGLILKPTDIHKICLLTFSLSMCLTCLSLIILQVQSNPTCCNLFGFMFLLTTVFSFLLLSVLCLELLYLVRFPIEDKRLTNRWYYYFGISAGISMLTFLVSLFSGQLWVPDVPSPFIKNYGTNKCQFDTSLERSLIIFVPVILSILLSFASLFLLRRYISINEKSKEIKSHVDWVVNKNTYKFLSRTYVLIILVASFWPLNLLYYAWQGSGISQLALDIIEASLGVVTLIVFVMNKYTWAEIKEKMCKKEEKEITEEQLRLNGIPTPETPGTELDDPFTNRNANLTTFGNNR